MGFKFCDKVYIKSGFYRGLSGDVVRKNLFSYRVDLNPPSGINSTAFLYPSYVKIAFWHLVKFKEKNELFADKLEEMIK